LVQKNRRKAERREQQKSTKLTEQNRKEQSRTNITMDINIVQFTVLFKVREIQSDVLELRIDERYTEWVRSR
jgi:hypothetical protein